MICKGEEPNFPVSDLSNGTWKRGLQLVIAEELNIIFSACRLGTEQLTESTVLECSLWGVSADPAVPCSACCRGSTKIIFMHL